MSPSLTNICWRLFAYRGATLTKVEFLQRLGLAAPYWRGPPRPMDGYLELSEGGTVRVRFPDWDAAVLQLELRVGIVVLAVEELLARDMTVPEELVAAATLALAEGAVVVDRASEAS